MPSFNRVGWATMYIAEKDNIFKGNPSFVKNIEFYILAIYNCNTQFLCPQPQTLPLYCTP